MLRCQDVSIPGFLWQMHVVSAYKFDSSLNCSHLLLDLFAQSVVFMVFCHVFFQCWWKRFCFDMFGRFDAVIFPSAKLALGEGSREAG